MLQHGTRRLRATAAEPVIELGDALGMRALVAGEGHASPASGDPVDRVHHARAYPLPFPPGVIAITRRLPWFEREGGRCRTVLGISEQRRLATLRDSSRQTAARLQESQRFLKAPRYTSAAALNPNLRRRSGGTYLNLLCRLTQTLSSGDAAYCSGAKRKDCTTCSKEL
jgi:hypothetical protein